MNFYECDRVKNKRLSLFISNVYMWIRFSFPPVETKDCTTVNEKEDRWRQFWIGSLYSLPSYHRSHSCCSFPYSGSLYLPQNKKNFHTHTTPTHIGPTSGLIRSVSPLSLFILFNKPQTIKTGITWEGWWWWWNLISNRREKVTPVINCSHAVFFGERTPVLFIFAL